MLKKTSEFRVLVTLSCTWYEYLWTYGSGKTFLLTQWNNTAHFYNTLNYLINAQPLLLIFKIRVNQGTGYLLRLICKIFLVFYLKKKGKHFIENWKVNIYHIQIGMCKKLISLLCRRKFVPSKGRNLKYCYANKSIFVT